MPTSLMKKVSDKCNMDMSKVEELWEKAKSQAKEQGHEEDWGYVTSIFKNMVSDSCKEKMGWTNEETIEDRVERYLSERFE